MIDLPIKVDHPAVHAPGVFFGMGDTEYHSAFALSSSGIRNMRVSTMNFWVDSALNPKPLKKDTTALRDGRAYDKRLTEGREAFDAFYAPELDPDEYPGALRTIPELKAAIARAGGPEKGLSAAKKADLAECLMKYDPKAQIWDRMLEDHALQHPGREFLPFDLVARIEMAAYMIEKDPEISRNFTGGAPQVSIFWIDDTTGVPFKARFDYFKRRSISDLKTTANVNKLPIKTAVTHAVANYRYHVQAALYLRAGHKARDLARRGLVYWPEGHKPSRMIDALCSCDDPFIFHFVVQQKGDAPVTRCRRLREEHAPNTLRIARDEIDEATLKFAQCWSAFGADRWVDAASIDDIDDSEFPSYMNVAA